MKLIMKNLLECFFFLHVHTWYLYVTKATRTQKGWRGSMVREWSVGGSCLCVYGKHPGCSWQNREADGSQGETYQCVEWHPEIITSNQSGAGSADRLRLMAPDCCLTALNKWGEENRAMEQQNQCPLHSSSIEKNALSVLVSMCERL